MTQFAINKRQKIRKGIIFISFLLFPITIYYFSPYLIVQAAFEGIVAGSFIIFTLMFLSSIFFGRAFCGWLCPAGGLQEAAFIVNKAPNKGGFRKLIKYGIWLPWVTIILLLLINAGGIKKVDMLYQTWHGISVSNPTAYIIYYGVVFLIVIFSYISGKRSFCHTICWMAPFMVLGILIRSKLGIPGLKMKTESEKCISCGNCNSKCSMSLDVKDLVKNQKLTSNIDCILCGECIDACPKKVIQFKML